MQHQIKNKSFGAQAKRLSRTELTTIVSYILASAGSWFENIAPVQQLDDKHSFGDVDIVVQTQRVLNHQLLKAIFGDHFLDIKVWPNSHVISTILNINHNIHQVDFIVCPNQESFDRRLLYYSKNHCSALIGLLAWRLGYKFGTEGFFWRYKRAGKEYDILLTGNLRDGMEILGLNVSQYEAIRTLDDIVTFVLTSPLFDSRFMHPQTLSHRYRERMAQNPTQAALVIKLRESQVIASLTDPKTVLLEKHPALWEKAEQKIRALEQQLSMKDGLGDQVMMQYGLKPGPLVGTIVGYLKWLKRIEGRISF